MRSIFFTTPGKVEIKETEIPLPNKGEALLKLLYGGICGSDLGTYRGTFSYVTYPRIPGHEFSAEIIDVDKNDNGLEKGMIVTCNPYFNCGSCYTCKKNRVNCCAKNQTMGVQREGAFSDFITMPLDRIYNGKNLHPKILALVEPFCISYHGVTRAQITSNDTVLIIGAGTIGVFAAIAAKKIGARVYMCDISPNKLSYAKRFGIDGTLLNDTPSHFEEQVKALTGNNGFDVAIEAVGLPSTFQDCINAASFYGRVVLIGVGKQNLDFNFTIIQKKELTIFGSRNALKNDFDEVIALLNSGLDISDVITNEYSADEFPKAIEEFHQNSDKMLKVMIKFT